MSKTYVFFPEDHCMTVAKEVELHAHFVDQLKVEDKTFQRADVENAPALRVLAGENTLGQDRLLIYFGETDPNFKVSRALPLIGSFWGKGIDGMSWLLSGCATDGQVSFDSDSFAKATLSYDLLSLAFGNFLAIHTMKWSSFNCNDLRLIQDGIFKQTIHNLGWFNEVKPKSEG